MVELICSDPGERTREFATFDEAYEYANENLFGCGWFINSCDEEVF